MITLVNRFPVKMKNLTCIILFLLSINHVLGDENKETLQQLQLPKSGAITLVHKDTGPESSLYELKLMKNDKSEVILESIKNNFHSINNSSVYRFLLACNENEDTIYILYYINTSFLRLVEFKKSTEKVTLVKILSNLPWEIRKRREPFVGFKFSPPNKIVLDDGYYHDDPGPWTVVGENLVDSKGNTLDREGEIIDAKKK